MWSFLSKMKESVSCENSRFKVGSSCMQGWRVSMEDSHTNILSLPDDQDAAFFAVYDGHGSANIAQHAGNNLHKFILQRKEYQNGDISSAVSEAFVDFDSTMMKDVQMRDEAAGTTAVIVLIKGDELFCGNVGDSRAVVCINGQDHALSLDHKPNNPMEFIRIREAGGWVKHNRVKGRLAMSRALGDFSYKRNASKCADEQMVIARPDVEQRIVSEDWEFLVLASDGVWDVLTNSDVVDFIRYRLLDRTQPEMICEEIMTTCLSSTGQGPGCDNMTIIIVCCLHGKTWEEYCGKLAASAVSNNDVYTGTLRNDFWEDMIEGNVDYFCDSTDNCESIATKNQNLNVEEFDVEPGIQQEASLVSILNTGV